MPPKGTPSKRKELQPVEPAYDDEVTATSNKKSKGNTTPSKSTTQSTSNTTPKSKPTPQQPTPTPPTTKSTPKSTTPITTKPTTKKGSVSFQDTTPIKSTTSTPTQPTTKSKPIATPANKKGAKPTLPPPQPVQMDDSSDNYDDEDDFDEDDFDSMFGEGEEFDFSQFEGEDFDFSQFGEGEGFDYDEDMEYDEDDEIDPNQQVQLGITQPKSTTQKQKIQYEATTGTGSALLRNKRPLRPDEASVPSAAPKDGKFPTTFSESNLSPELQKSLKSMNITTPTKLQQAALGPLLHGKDALMIAGPTSGKTITAMIPALQLMLEAGWKQRNFTGCMIIVPTRERALLTYQTLQLLTAHNPGLTHGLVLGNTNPIIQFQRINKGISVIVATPERLLQHMENKDTIFFKNTMSLILDDVDTMCDMGFEEILIKIARKLDPLRHTMCISSVNTRPVQKIAKSIMRTPLLIGCQSQESMKITIDGKTKQERAAELLQQELIKFDSVNNNYIHHGYITTPTAKRFDLLYTYIKKSLTRKSVIFVHTPDEVKHLQGLFRAFDIVTLGLHEGLKETQRTKTFFEFQNSTLGGILFTTDLVLRGLKFNCKIDTIIHYDTPLTVLGYLQRLSHFPQYTPPPPTTTPTTKTKKATTTTTTTPVVDTKPLKLSSIIFILEENENNILEQLTSKLTFVAFEKPSLITIKKECFKLVDTNFFLNRSALDSYFSFMRCVVQYAAGGTYNYKGINKVGLANSFGLEFPPQIKE